jgi:hypothetical protein
MRKITLLLFLSALVVSTSFAQKNSVAIDKTFEMPQIKGESDITDTLMPASFLTGTPIMYTVTAGGYMVGPNDYGDLAKAQLYTVATEVNVEGIEVWFGVNDLTTGSLSFKVWNGDGSVELATKDANFADIDIPEDGGMFSVIFDEPVSVTGDFMVGVEWTDLTDGFGIISTTNGDAGGTDLAFEKWSDGNWYSLNDSWTTDLDLGFFALVNMPEASSTEAEILTFVFDEEVSTAIIDSESAQVTTTVAWNTDFAELVPEITISEGAQVTSTTDPAVFMKGMPTLFRVTAEDGVTSKLWSVNVLEEESSLLTYFSEDFETVTANEDIALTDWANVAEVGTKKWIGKTYNENSYAQFSSYSSSSPEENTAWLVTPAIDFDKTYGEYISFDVNIGYFNH